MSRFWGPLHIDWCDRHKTYPRPTDGGIWAQMIVAANHQAQMQLYLLDFLYRKTEGKISLELQHFPVPAQNLNSTTPWIYGSFGRHLPMAFELGEKIKAGKATAEENELFMLLADMLPLKTLDVEKALRLAKLIVRDFHFNDRDSEGRLHIGSTIDAILLPWKSEAIFIALDETVLEK